MLAGDAASKPAPDAGSIPVAGGRIGEVKVRPWFGPFRKKDWRAKVNSEHELTVKAGQNLLAAGLAAGLDWPHDCKVGSCGTCRCFLKRGKIRPLSDFSYVLTPDQLDQGAILACQTALKSDVVIEVRLDEVGKIAAVAREGTLSAVRRLTHDIVEMTITCDEPFPAGILAGQYAEIAYPGLSKPRSYSFAKAPENEKEREITFYVRLVPGGEFTEWLFGENREGTRLTVTGPHGSFHRHDKDVLMLCIAGGSGMSAIKAMLEAACNARVRRDAVFLFGARTQADIYCRDEIEYIRSNWHKDCNFEFEFVLSNEPDDSDWDGPRGFVTEHLYNNYIKPGRVDTAACQAYMCGPPPMIDAGIKALTEVGVGEESIFYDKFLDASSIPGGR